MEPKSEGLAKLNELLKQVNIAMFTTVGSDGWLHSRPMGTQEAESDGDLWFFTSDDSKKVAEIKEDARVNVSYSEQKKDLWISVSGKASIVTDKAEMEKRWSPILKAWFPQGLETPNLCLIQVHADRAEYWDNPNGKIVELFSLVKGALTGEPEQMGENKTVEL